LDSELFAWHSARMTDIILKDTRSVCPAHLILQPSSLIPDQNTDPHRQLILEYVLLAHGRRTPAFFRAQTRWQPIIPLLMDAICLDIDDSVAEFVGRGAPIEAKLRLLAIQLLYEVCRSQKLTIVDLRR
jgi:hypothetical protein